MPKIILCILYGEKVPKHNELTNYEDFFLNHIIIQKKNII